MKEEISHIRINFFLSAPGRYAPRPSSLICTWKPVTIAVTIVVIDAGHNN